MNPGEDIQRSLGRIEAALANLEREVAALKATRAASVKWALGIVASVVSSVAATLLAIHLR